MPQKDKHTQPWQGAIAKSGDTYFAEIAQLVEHNLAKVGVASSSLVFRSKTMNDSVLAVVFCFVAERFRAYIDNPPKPSFEKEGFVMSEKRQTAFGAVFFLSFLERILRIDIDNPPKPSFEKEGFA